MIQNAKNNLRPIVVGFWEYILAFLLILDCRSVYSTSEKGIYINILIICISGVLIGTQLLVSKLNRHILCNYFIFLLLFIGYCLVFIVFNHYNVASFVVRILLFVPLAVFYLTFSKGTLQSIVLKYSNLMCIIALISLFFWILGSLLKVIHPNSQYLLNWGSIRLIPNYYNLYFETQPLVVFSHVVIRDTSIFTEGPMFSLNLSIAFLTEMYYRPKVQIKRVLLIICTIIATMSVTGIILVAFFIFAKYLFTKSLNANAKLLKVMFVAIGLIGVIAIVVNLVLFKSTNSSYSTRLDDYIAGFITWKQNPVFGIGFTNLQGIVSNMSLFRKDNLGFSNSITQVLAQGGLYLFFMYFFFFFVNIRNAVRYHSTELGIFTVGILFLFITTVFSYNYILLLILSSGVSIYCKQKM